MGRKRVQNFWKKNFKNCERTYFFLVKGVFSISFCNLISKSPSRERENSLKHRNSFMSVKKRFLRRDFSWVCSFGENLEVFELKKRRVFKLIRYIFQVKALEIDWNKINRFVLNHSWRAINLFTWKFEDSHFYCQLYLWIFLNEANTFSSSISESFLWSWKPIFQWAVRKVLDKLFLGRFFSYQLFSSMNNSQSLGFFNSNFPQRDHLILIITGNFI